jgi:hypothetical protein
LWDFPTYGGVRHFIFVDAMIWFKNSFSSCMLVFTATYNKSMLGSAKFSIRKWSSEKVMRRQNINTI